MRTVGIIILFFAISAGTCLAETTASSFDQANMAYAQGDYQQAASLLEQLIAEHGYSGAVLYNLGNSYAQLGDPGRAVLAWERASRLLPGDSDIAHNFSAIRNQQGIFEEKPQPLAGFLAIDQWALLGLACLLLGTLSTLAARLIPRLRPPLLRFTALWIMGLTLSMAAVLSLRGSYQALVVLEDNTRLLVSPFAASASQGSLQAGRLLVAMPERYGQFFYVQAGEKRFGWVAGSQVAAIIPEGEQR